MLMHLDVPLTLLCADAARCHTRLDLCSAQLHVGLGQPGQDAPGRHANFGAVEVQADAPDEFLDGLFTQAGVRTHELQL